MSDDEFLRVPTVEIPDSSSDGAFTRTTPRGSIRRASPRRRKKSTGGSKKERRRSRREKRKGSKRTLANSTPSTASPSIPLTDSKRDIASEERHRHLSRDSKIYEVAKKTKPRRSIGASEVMDASFFSGDVHGTTIAHSAVTQSTRRERLSEEDEFPDVGPPTRIEEDSSLDEVESGSVLYRLRKGAGDDCPAEESSVRKMLKDARAEREAHRQEEQVVMADMALFSSSSAPILTLDTKEIHQKKEGGWKKMFSSRHTRPRKDKSPRSRDSNESRPDPSGMGYRKASAPMGYPDHSARLKEFLSKRPSQEELEHRGILHTPRRESSRKISAKHLESFLTTRPNRNELVSRQLLKFDLFDQPLEKLALMGHSSGTEDDLGPLDVVIQYLQGQTKSHGSLLVPKKAFEDSDCLLQVVEVKNALEKAASSFQPANLSGFPVSAVAQFFIEFLRQMPQPVVPYRMYTRVMNTSRVEDSDLRVGQLHTLFHCLPPLHLVLLRRICFLLYSAHQHSPKNGMNARKLANDFGPVILRPHETLTGSPRRKGSVASPKSPRAREAAGSTAIGIVETMVLEYHLLFDHLPRMHVFDSNEAGDLQLAHATKSRLIAALLDPRYNEMDPTFADVVFLTHSYVFRGKKGGDNGVEETAAEALLGALVRQFSKLNKQPSLRIKTWQHPLRLRILRLLLKWVEANQAHLEDQGEFMMRLLEFSRPLPRLGGQASLIPEEARVFAQLYQLCGRDRRSASVAAQRAALARSALLRRLQLPGSGGARERSVIRTPASSVVGKDGRKEGEGDASTKDAAARSSPRARGMSVISTENAEFSNDSLLAALSKYGGEGGPCSPRTDRATPSLVTRSAVPREPSISELTLSPPSVLIRNQVSVENLVEGGNDSLEEILALDIRQHDPQKMANMLTAVAAEQLGAITPMELLHTRFADAERSPAFAAMAEKFNDTSHWVGTEVLQAEKSADRAAIITHFLRICKALRHLNNFHSLFAIVSGLTNTAISRLHSTWEKVSRKHQKHLAAYQDLLDPSRNYSAYRAVLAKTKPPLVPYLVIITTELIATEEIPTFVPLKQPDGESAGGEETKLINVRKCRGLYTTIKSLEECKSVPYDETISNVDNSLCEMLESVKVFDEDQLYDHSYRLEPRKGT